MWESWQTLRKSIGKSCRGRSKSRRWREVNINKNKLGAAESNPLLLAAENHNSTANNIHHERLNDISPQTSTAANAAKPVIAASRRQRRVSSLQSEDSFSSGRLSPRTSSLQEILVATAPPTPIPEDNLPTTIPPAPSSAYSSPLLAAGGGSTGNSTPRYSLNNEYYDNIDHQIENCFTSSSPTKLPGDNHASDSNILQSLHNPPHDDNLMPLSPPLSPTASDSPPPAPPRKTRSSNTGGGSSSTSSQNLVFVDLPPQSTTAASNSTENYRMNVNSTANTTASNSFCFSSSDLLLKTAPPTTTTSDHGAPLTPTKRQLLRHNSSDSDDRKGNLARTPPPRKSGHESLGAVGARKVAGVVGASSDKKNILR